VIEAMGLGFEYSQVSMLYKADVVYEFAVLELTSLSLPDNWYQFWKASEFEDNAQHCQWSYRWASSVGSLKVAFDHIGLSNFYVPHY
jgi:hypothetical protein